MTYIPESVRRLNVHSNFSCHYQSRRRYFIFARLYGREHPALLYFGRPSHL